MPLHDYRNMEFVIPQKNQLCIDIESVVAGVAMTIPPMLQGALEASLSIGCLST